MPKFALKHDVVYAFKVSRIADGAFKNLWQLKISTPENEEFVENIDADSLSMCLDRIRYIFEQDGF
jgi:hypothetical protein